MPTLTIAYVQALLQSIPSKVRNAAYGVLGVVGLLLGSLAVAGVETVPVIAVSVASASKVVVFVAGALGFVAKANVTPDVE